MRGRYAVVRAGLAAIGIAACDGSAPVDVGTKTAVVPPVVTPEAPRIAASPPDSALVERYPSLVHYPAVAEPLRAALERGADAREVLVALAASMAPHRWPSMHDWDRHGFIALDGATPGYVTRVAGELVRQPTERHDLGCAGGFLEGVRLTLLPRLEIADLDRCEAAQTPIVGAPTGCDPEREYGWIALANIAARLAATQLPVGARLVEVDVEAEGGLVGLAAPDAMHLCTVSHVSARYEQSRFFHHMMIVLGTPDGASLDIFDTTGARGVSVVTMPRARFVRYCTVTLRSSDEYRYRRPQHAADVLAGDAAGRSADGERALIRAAPATPAAR